MDSSFEMFNRSSYFPIYPYPFSVSSELSSFRSNNNNHITTNDYSSSYYPDHPSNSSGIDMSLDRYNSRNDRCLVCNDRSSGIHFGVLTCEACKAFFRRTSLSTYPIALPCSPNRCEINIKNRNNCPSCRFDKCKRLGMDRDNVIYGKPSKQQNHSIDQQDYTNISNQLIKIFQTIHSIDHKQQIDTFGHIAFQLFYEQTSQIYHQNSSDVIHRIFHLIFDSYKTNLISDYCLNLRAILSLWLFVYYYETFLLKQNISQDKLIILIQFLDIELKKLDQYYSNEQIKQNIYRIDFLNTFTKFADLIEEIYSDN